MSCDHPGRDWDSHYYCMICNELLSTAEADALRKVALEAQQVWRAWNQNPQNEIVLERRMDDLEKALLRIDEPTALAGEDKP